MRHLPLAAALALLAGCTHDGSPAGQAGGPSRSLLDAYFIAHGMAFGSTSYRVNPAVEAELDRLDDRAAAALGSLRPGVSGGRQQREAEAAVAALTSYAAAQAGGLPSAVP